MEDDGEIVSLSDESDITSLNDEAVNFLRKKYALAKKLDISDEVKFQRHVDVHNLEEQLRLEEAKLCMLKKIRQNQQDHQHHVRNFFFVCQIINTLILGEQQVT